MRPDTPAENVDHAAEAARLERTAGLYPEDAESLLLRAAAHLELSGDRPAATALYDRLLGSAADLDNPHLVRALKASNLWEYGHEAEARAIIDGIRAAAPRDPAPWVIVAEALESHDELEAAHDTFTEGARLLLTDTDEPPTPPTRSSSAGTGYAACWAPPTTTGTPWPTPSTRHRCPWTNSTTPTASGPSARTTRPNWPPRSPASAPNSAPTARPSPAPSRWQSCTGRSPNWPNSSATTRPWPPEYPSYEAHLATVETSLRELAASGTQNLGIVTGTVPSYEAFAASESTTPPPTPPSSPPQYATTLAARGRAIPLATPAHGSLLVRVGEGVWGVSWGRRGMTAPSGGALGRISTTAVREARRQ
ncbi:SEC-C domain-containing protein [Streptomyces thermocoprophilus]